MQEWTCDKAYGSRTFALTQNAAEVMYDCWFDRRGNRRARVKSSDALADTMVTVTGRLRRFAAECEQPTGSLQELLAAAEACGIRPTDEELAGLKYRDLQWQHKRIAEGYIVRTSPATARAARCAMVVAVAEAEVASLQTTNSSASVPILTDCGVRLLEPQHDRMQSADTVSLRSDTALCNPFSPWYQKHGGTLIPRCQQCEQAVGTAREAFKALLVDSDGADVHTTATILGVARQKGTKNGLPSEASVVQMDAQRREALHELYTLCRSLPDVALECPASAEESHGGIVAYWLQREWPTVSLRGLRVQASARTAAAQPPDSTDVWVYGQQVEVLQNFDKTPVWLTARYIRGSGSTNTVELLSQTNDGVTVVKDAALRRMPPWPLADWATRMLAGGAIDAPFHGGFASARLMKVDQKAGGVISWKARLQVTKTDITVNPADARPAWTLTTEEAYEYAETSRLRRSVPSMLLLAGTRVRITGRHDLCLGLDARIGTALAVASTSDWYVRLDGDDRRSSQRVAVHNLQPIEPPPSERGVPTLQSLADEAAVSYFQRAAEEARLIASTLTDTLPAYADVLRTPKAPEAEASAIAEEYRQVLKPFADVDELLDAFQRMNANKTGRTIALSSTCSTCLGGTLVVF